MKFFITRALKPLLTLLILVVSLGSALPAQAQDRPLWLRYPAISPDGQTILFCYKGDIYKVPSSGGQAVPLTISESYEFAPVWSHDGKPDRLCLGPIRRFRRLMMASSRGNSGHVTAADIPSASRRMTRFVILFGRRQELRPNAQFPCRSSSQLYSVPAEGGESLVLPGPAMDRPRFDPAGDKIIYHDHKGYESTGANTTPPP